MTQARATPPPIPDAARATKLDAPGPLRRTTLPQQQPVPVWRRLQRQLEDVGEAASAAAGGVSELLDDVAHAEKAAAAAAWEARAVREDLVAFRQQVAAFHAKVAENSRSVRKWGNGLEARLVRLVWASIGLVGLELLIDAVQLYQHYQGGR